MLEKQEINESQQQKLNTRLLMAVIKSDTNRIDTALAAGANANTTLPGTSSVLYHSVFDTVSSTPRNADEKFAVTLKLLEHGANPNADNSSNLSKPGTLSLAAIGGNIKTFTKFLQHKDLDLETLQNTYSFFYQKEPNNPYAEPEKKFSQNVPIEVKTKILNLLDQAIENYQIKQHAVNQAKARIARGALHNLTSAAGNALDVAEAAEVFLEVLGDNGLKLLSDYSWFMYGTKVAEYAQEKDMKQKQILGKAIKKHIDHHSHSSYFAKDGTVLPQYLAKFYIDKDDNKVKEISPSFYQNLDNAVSTITTLMKSKVRGLEKSANYFKLKETIRDALLASSNFSEIKLATNLGLQPDELHILSGAEHVVASNSALRNISRVLVKTMDTIDPEDNSARKRKVLLNVTLDDIYVILANPYILEETRTARSKQ